MRRLFVILICFISCAPYRTVPYLTTRQAADQCPGMIGAEVVVSVPAGAYRLGPTGLEVVTGRPDAPPLLTFRGIHSTPTGPIHVRGVVLRAVPCEPGLGFSHRVEFEDGRIMSRVR